MTTIYEIAQRVGVSTATVSRAINQTGYVSDTTRNAILKVVEELNYVPNENAVVLKKGKTQIVGIITAYFTDSFAVFLRNFTLAAQNQAYHIHLIVTNGEEEQGLKALELLRKKQVDGLCIFTRVGSWEAIASYTQYGPIVTAQRVDLPLIPSVYLDHYVGYKIALEHLYKQGYRKIANLFSTKRNLNTVNRLQAYQDFCKSKSLIYREDFLFFDQDTMQDGMDIAEWWLRQKEKPDAFATARLKKSGVEIPREVAIIGFDNLEIAQLLDMSTIYNPIGQQAEEAFKLIYNQLKKEYSDVNVLQQQLVVRSAT